MAISDANSKRLLLLSLLVFLLNLWKTQAYRPVILMHGIVSKAEFMQPVADHIEKFYPGTSILNVDLYDEADSLVAMDLQVDGVREKVKPFMEKAKDGVNMVCYSQGKKYLTSNI